jgi:hypothetical protein
VAVVKKTDLCALESTTETTDHWHLVTEPLSLTTCHCFLTTRH